MLGINVRIVGPEDCTLFEKFGVSLQALPALVELLTPNESYMEISVKEQVSNNNGENHGGQK